MHALWARDPLVGYLSSRRKIRKRKPEGGPRGHSPLDLLFNQTRVGERLARAFVEGTVTWRRSQASRVQAEVRTDSGAILSGSVLNLTGSGVFIRTVQLLPASRGLTLRFHLSGGTEPLQDQGWVIWSNPEVEKGSPQGIGVVFLDLAKEWVDQIATFVAQISRGGAACGGPSSSAGEEERRAMAIGRANA